MVLICFTFCCLFANQGCHLVLHVLFVDLKVDCFFLLYVTLCCGPDFAAAELSVLDSKADGSHLLYVLLPVC